MSDISLNSDKTDCEDKLQRHKIIITPIDKTGVYEILGEYFSECQNQNSEEFHHSLYYGALFGDLNNLKTLKTVKNHYMRRRVCMKFFKIFEKLVRIY